MEERNFKSKLRLVLLILGILVLVGTLGFRYFSFKSWWDSLYLTIIIILTHFYHKVDEPRIIQVLVVFLGLGSFVIIAFLLKWLTEYIVEGQLTGKLKKNKMKREIVNLENHYIICGFGRVGKQIAKEFSAEKVPFVVIDRDPKEAEELEKKSFFYVNQDPVLEKSLEAANIKTAKGLITVLGEDADNLFVTLAARSLNPKLFIVSRCNLEENKGKMGKAGADRVVSPHQIGGFHMATMALRPAVVDFLDIIIAADRKELQIEEVVIPEQSSLIGKTLGEWLKPEEQKINVLALAPQKEAFKINPSQGEILHSNDKVILFGAKNDLEKVIKTI